MANRERRLHLAHFSLDSDGDDSDETNTPTRVHANGHTCALVWCDEDSVRDPPPGCRPVDPLAGLASMGETYRGVRGDEAVAACVGPCATSAHVIPDATQRPKPDEHLGGHVFTSSSSSALKTKSSPTAISAATMALCVRVAAALREGEDASTGGEPWRPSRVCELGAGTGAAGLTVARVLTGRTHDPRPLVVLTDRDTAALEVLAGNVAMNAPRTWARCVAQRLQWDRRDERSAVLQRAANDDRMRSNTNDDDLSDETSFVPPVAKPYDLLIASDVLTGSTTDDGHLLDTATELLTGAGVGARLILAHHSKQIREKTNEALSHRDFVDEDTYEDTGVDTDHASDPDPALTPFLNAARARGFHTREFEPSASSSSFSFVRVFDVFIPGTVPGSHLAAYGDAEANLELERVRTETRALQTHMRERYARGWTPPEMPEVPTMEPPKEATREEDDIANINEAEETTKAGRSPGAKKKKKDAKKGDGNGGGFCVVM